VAGVYTQGVGCFGMSKAMETVQIRLMKRQIQWIEREVRRLSDAGFSWRYANRSEIIRRFIEKGIKKSRAKSMLPDLKLT